MATRSAVVGRGTHAPRLSSEDAVIRALEHFDDVVTAPTSSVLEISHRGRRSHDAFGSCFLHRIDEHEELVRRMRRLGERERLLLVLWYSQGWPVTHIAARLQVSRVHCYRLRDRALTALTRPLDHTA